MNVKLVAELRRSRWMTLIPEYLRDNEDFLVFFALLIHEFDISLENIRTFTDLVNPDKVPIKFIQSLGAYFDYKYLSNADDEFNRELSMRMRSIWEQRGTEHAIIMAGSHAGNDGYVGGDIFIPGYPISKERAKLTVPRLKVFKHSTKSVFSGDHYFVKWGYNSDGILWLEVPYFDDNVRQRVFEVTQAGLAYIFFTNYEFWPSPGADVGQWNELSVGKWLRVWPKTEAERISRNANLDMFLESILKIVPERNQDLLIHSEQRGRLHSGKRMFMYDRDVDMLNGVSMLPLSHLQLPFGKMSVRDILVPVIDGMVVHNKSLFSGLDKYSESHFYEGQEEMLRKLSNVSLIDYFIHNLSKHSGSDKFETLRAYQTLKELYDDNQYIISPTGEYLDLADRSTADHIIRSLDFWFLMARLMDYDHTIWASPGTLHGIFNLVANNIYKPWDDDGYEGKLDKFINIDLLYNPGSYWSLIHSFKGFSKRFHSGYFPALLQQDFDVLGGVSMLNTSILNRPFGKLTEREIIVPTISGEIVHNKSKFSGRDKYPIKSLYSDYISSIIPPIDGSFVHGQSVFSGSDFISGRGTYTRFENIAGAFNLNRSGFSGRDVFMNRDLMDKTLADRAERVKRPAKTPSTGLVKKELYDDNLYIISPTGEYLDLQSRDTIDGIYHTNFDESYSILRSRDFEFYIDRSVKVHTGRLNHLIKYRVSLNPVNRPLDLKARLAGMIKHRVSIEPVDKALPLNLRFTKLSKFRYAMQASMLHSLKGMYSMRKFRVSLIPDNRMLDLSSMVLALIKLKQHLYSDMSFSAKAYSLKKFRVPIIPVNKLVELSAKDLQFLQVMHLFARNVHTSKPLAHFMKHRVQVLADRLVKLEVNFQRLVKSRSVIYADKVLTLKALTERLIKRRQHLFSDMSFSARTHSMQKYRISLNPVNRPLDLSVRDWFIIRDFDLLLNNSHKAKLLSLRKLKQHVFANVFSPKINVHSLRKFRYSLLPVNRPLDLSAKLSKFLDLLQHLYSDMSFSAKSYSLKKFRVSIIPVNKLVELSAKDLQFLQVMHLFARNVHTSKPLAHFMKHKISLISDVASILDVKSDYERCIEWDKISLLNLLSGPVQRRTFIEDILRVNMSHNLRFCKESEFRVLIQAFHGGYLAKISTEIKMLHKMQAYMGETKVLEGITRFIKSRTVMQVDCSTMRALAMSEHFFFAEIVGTGQGYQANFVHLSYECYVSLLFQFRVDIKVVSKEIDHQVKYSVALMAKQPFVEDVEFGYYKDFDVIVRSGAEILADDMSYTLDEVRYLTPDDFRSPFFSQGFDIDYERVAA